MKKKKKAKSPQFFPCRGETLRLSHQQRPKFDWTVSEAERCAAVRGGRGGCVEVATERSFGAISNLFQRTTCTGTKRRSWGDTKKLGFWWSINTKHTLPQPLVPEYTETPPPPSSSSAVRFRVMTKTRSQRKVAVSSNQIYLQGSTLLNPTGLVRYSKLAVHMSPILLNCHQTSPTDSSSMFLHLSSRT